MEKKQRERERERTGASEREEKGLQYIIK